MNSGAREVGADALLEAQEPRGTASTSHTPLALIRKTCPAARIAPASTASTTGLPRRAPTRVAVSRSGDRCTWWRAIGRRPSARIESSAAATVPW
ncbi:hypothetical protein WKI68_23220 [Streptomyces sp. MS1.HAVA.3]|uniref:Uncharacterized protein n=1 Tax=Streptomyces caledonius TaxID=3134107 RepID=A0ABU8U8M3_9ACTN